MLKNLTFRFVIDQVKRYWKETLLGTFLLILTNGIGVLIPIQIKKAVDLLATKHFQVDSQILLFLLGIAGLAVLMAFIRTGSRVVLFGIGRKVESDQKQLFYEHLLKLDLAYFSTQRIGDLISRATSDIQAIRQMMGFGLLNVINIVWLYALTLPLMISLNADLTFWILIGYLPILFFVKFLSNKLKTQQQKAQEDLGALSSFIEEDLNGIQVIKAYSQEEREINRFKKINDQFLNVSIDLAKWRGLIWPIMQLAGGISFFVLLIYANKGALTVGTAAAFLICLERLVFPTAILGWLITIFQRGSVSVERVNEIFAELPQIVDKSNQPLKVESGSIEIKNLNIEFEQGVKILSNLSLEFKAGEFVGVVGMIGSGKSTMCKSILRLIHIPDQAVFIDSQDINLCKITSLREQVGFVPQEAFLFNASIAENIGFFGKFSQAQIEESAKLAQIHDEIMSFPNGYETITGERGVMLSGGQAQRVSLARAIVANPKILLLDDSISSVDNEIGLTILNSLRERFKDLTLILITHRISSLKEADRIYILDKGSCVGQGKHSQLLRHNEVYQKLWKLQLVAKD
ncbi:MAG: ABC transporter ATP-binding protein [Candidatus Melainabacteria bacterium]|jgi:ATP-binding cassette subfamily B protein